jgi:hypothetical protein
MSGSILGRRRSGGLMQVNLRAGRTCRRRGSVEEDEHEDVAQLRASVFRRKARPRAAAEPGQRAPGRTTFAGSSP